MRRLTKRERNLIIGVLAFAIIGLFVYYYYFPLEEKIKGMREESEMLSLDIDEAKITKTMVDDAKKTRDELSEKSLEHEEYLMESIDEPILLTYIEDIVLDRSEEQAVSYNEVADNDLYYHKDINFNLETKYNLLTEMLERFEEGDYYSTLNSISINRKELESLEPDEMYLSVTYSLRFYGSEATWEDKGQYEFMDGGKYKKANPFGMR